MKKQNAKVLRAANRRVAKYNHRMASMLALSIFAIITVIAIVSLCIEPSTLGNLFTWGGAGGGSLVASMMVIGNLDDLPDTDTTGKNLWGEVYLIDVSDQIDTASAFPKPNAAREVGTLPMKTGEYMKKFMAHTAPTFLSTGEKGEFTVTGENTFAIVMAGQRKQLLNFSEQHVGKRFILIFKQLDSDTRYILGSYERPVYFQSFENKMDNDGRYVTYTFKREGVQQYHEYTGSMVLQAAGTHTAGQTTLAITAGQDVYTIPNGSSATYGITGISGLTASDKGRVITLLGAGTTYSATVADGAAFTLEDAATWTAKAGSKLVLKVLDASTLVEVGGSRIQTA